MYLTGYSRFAVRANFQVMQVTNNVAIVINLNVFIFDVYWLVCLLMSNQQIKSSL